MSRRKAFAVALYAMRLDPEQVLVSEETGGRVGWKLESTEEHVNLAPDVHVLADFILAGSAEEATASALENVLSTCPKEEGWIAHHANVLEVARDELLDAVRVSEGEEDDDASPIM